MDTNHSCGMPEGSEVEAPGEHDSRTPAEKQANWISAWLDAEETRHGEAISNTRNIVRSMIEECPPDDIPPSVAEIAGLPDPDD